MGLIPFVKDRVTFLIYDKDDILVGTLECEATLGAQHARDAQVTTHPVAKGESTTDNVRPDPDGLVLDCFWGNYAVDPVLFGKRYGTAQFHAAEDAYEKLNDIYRNAFRLSFKMRLWTYENMVIKGMSVAETVEDGNSVKVSITFREIKIAVSKTIPRVKASPTKVGPKQAAGVKPKTAPSPAVKQSVLARGADASGASRGSVLFKKPPG